MKRLFTQLPLFLISLAAMSAMAGEWIADAKTGCKVWNTAPVSNESATWSGSCLEGLASGQGILNWFRDGHMNGTATGTFSGGKLAGKAVIEFSNGNVYEGDFVDGKRTGKGFLKWPDGDAYEGDFVDGKRTGKGVLKWPNGDAYEGDFVDGKRTGKGVLKWPNGDAYEGDFVDGKMTGKGAFIWPVGPRLEGNFVDGEITGKGVYVRTNGDRFDVSPPKGKSSVELGSTCSMQVKPSMPPEAMRTKTAGVVQALALLVNGAIDHVTILSGPQVYHDAVREAMIQYKCVNSPVQMLVTQEFRFSFDGKIGATCVEQPPPYMPWLAERAGIEGLVKAQAFIVDGVVKDVAILSGPAVFRQSVRDAMLQYKCPDMVGQAVVTQEFNFTFHDLPPKYSIRQVGPIIESSVNSSSQQLPLNKSYQNLSFNEKTIFRASYKNLPAADEPPFPLAGLGEFQNYVLKGAEKMGVHGDLSLTLKVDSSGTPISAQVFKTPNLEFGRFAASVAMLTHFKPGLCGGQPCEMDFPINLEVIRKP